MNTLILDFLNSYADNTNPQYAVMLKGKWGCGKTHLIKEWKKRFDGTADTDEEITLKPIYISTYGMDSVNDIKTAIDRELNPFFYSKTGRFIKGPNFSSYKTIGWVNSGLHKLNRQPAPEYKKAYEVHNTYSQHNGAIVLKGTFYIHAGPEDLTHIGWGAAGCVEIIGSFSEFKDQVKELSGSTQVDADSAISELVFYKKLYIEIEYATPPNIKANFYKEVSIKRR